MSKSTSAIRLLLGGLLAVSASVALASEGGSLPSAQTNLRDTAGLQRGAKLFMNYCSGCHSLKYLRYSRMAKDLHLSQEQVMRYLNFTGAKFGSPILSSMPAEQAENWFGKAPPDLSLVVKAKGADWVSAYLHSFYLDPSATTGWNNTVFPNASMPNVLWPLQGVQKLVSAEHAAAEGAAESVVAETSEHGESTADGHGPTLVLAEAGRMTPEQFDQAIRDLTSFLQYAAEPAALQRRSMGVWVLLYLGFFTLLAWFLKKEFWKDIH